MSDLSIDDLCNLIANNLDNHATPSSVKRYLKAIYKTILRQLELNQRIYFKDFGYFEVKERKSGERLINDPVTNNKRLVYVEPRLSIFFKASENFDFAVNENNFRMITDKGVKRKKKKEKLWGNVADLLNKANSRKE